MTKTQADRDRESRLQYIEHRARQANQLSRDIRDLSTTLESLKAGKGEWKVKSDHNPHTQWDYMAGLGSRDNDELRKLVIQYVIGKLAEKEAEFDKL